MARRAPDADHASPPASRIGGDACGPDSRPGNRRPSYAGPSSDSPFYQALCFAFQVNARVLMSLAASKCGNAPHEIKTAFRLAMFFAQNVFDDVQG